MTYYIEPTDGRKSFYQKAKVTDDNGVKTLTSYATDVCKIEDECFGVKVFVKLWGGYSVTTMRHINSFREMNGFSKLSKSEWESMPINGGVKQ